MTKFPENGRRDADEAVDLLASRVAKEYPNPALEGCPPGATLRDIAYRRIPIREAKIWADHICACGPCSEKLGNLTIEAEAERSRTKEWFPRRGVLRLVWAGAIIVAVVALWFFLKGGIFPSGSATATIDLRAVPPRGMEPAQPPLELKRSVSRAKIYLASPDGEGAYDLRIAGESSTASVTSNGIARRSGDLIVLEIRIDVKSLPPGPYTLQIRGPRGYWEYYPLTVR